MKPTQEQALREYLREAIIPLIEDVLVKKIGQGMTFAAGELKRSKKEWQGLTDEELLDIADMAYANDLELLQTLQTKLKEKNHG